MNIGIIGAGNIGAAFAKRLGAAGHQVMPSFHKDSGELEATARAPAPPSQAASFGEVVVLSVPWSTIELALRQAGPLYGKVLWDCTNALTPDLTGLDVGTTTSGGEIVAHLAPGARVVNGIPPSAPLLLSDNPTIGGKPVGCFLCSDDAAAGGCAREPYFQPRWSISGRSPTRASPSPP